MWYILFSPSHQKHTNNAYINEYKLHKNEYTVRPNTKKYRNRTLPLDFIPINLMNNNLHCNPNLYINI